MRIILNWLAVTLSEHSVSAAVSIHSPHAIAAIYSQHNGWLLRWLRGKLACADQAADLAQDTFVRLLTTSADPASLREPRAYLTTVAGRLVIDHYRRQSLMQAWHATLAQLPEQCAPSPEDRLELLQTLERIDRMLDGLGARVRAAFLMAQLDGLTYADIADRLGTSERTIKRYMVQAFERCILCII